MSKPSLYMTQHLKIIFLLLSNYSEVLFKFQNTSHYSQDIPLMGLVSHLKLQLPLYACLILPTLCFTLTSKATTAIMSIKYFFFFIHFINHEVAMELPDTS